MKYDRNDYGYNGCTKFGKLDRISSRFGISKKSTGRGVKKNESRTAFFSEKLQKKLEINIVGENMHILSEMIYKTVSDTQ